MRIPTLGALCATIALSPAFADGGQRPIRLPREPALSPDGATLAFAWEGDVWLAPIAGGAARRVTLHGADDSSPAFHPSGNELAFVSGRSGDAQIHVVALDGGEPRQVTFDTERKTLVGYTADGNGFVVLMSTDRGFGGSESQRAFVLDAKAEAPPRMLLDAGVRSAALSPSGSHLVFTRGRSAWERKGYIGPQAEQLWLADLSGEAPQLTRLDEDREGYQNVNHIQPFWAPDGRSLFYVSDPDGTFDLYQRRLEGGEVLRITEVRALDRSDDGVAFPVISADGRTIVLRRRFDLLRMDVGKGELKPIELQAASDGVASAIERRVETSATEVAFTDDGQQIAFVSGEDVWVMDRILREPKRVTDTPHAETSLAFSADGKRLHFVSDAGGEVDLYTAKHAREDGVWWLADTFEVERLTNDPAVESRLQLSPTGEHIAYLRDSDLWVMDDDGSDHRRLVEAWSGMSYDWAPDGKWIVYATEDSDYNSDVFVTKLDGTLPPFNLSRHPDMDGSPVWSGDGKRIAFVSMRDGEEADIYWVDLTKEEAERTARDRKLEEALEALAKAKKAQKDPKKGAEKGAEGGKQGADGDAQSAGDGTQEKVADKKKKDEDSSAKDVRIDFDGLFERLQRISISESREGGLIWSPDGKTLAFSATVGGERGFYKVEFPNPGRPTKLASAGLSSARWLRDSKELVGLARGGDEGGAPNPLRRGGGASASPAALSAAGKLETFGFSVRRVRDWSELRKIAFDEGWRAMRDNFYDPAHNNRDWNLVRAKYRDVAGQCLGSAEFSHLMNMMLGELNASHMGHRGGTDPQPDPVDQDAWTPGTHHLGLRFELDFAGPGLRVESVIPNGPTSLARSTVAVGETVLSIDGTLVGPTVNVARLLTLDEARDVVLEVADAQGAKRTVTVRPVRSVAGLMYDEWVERNRSAVDVLSGGKLGYLHIRGMDFPSFRQLEQDLFHAGYGKDGLVIDVRFNGGGSTADHVLTALTQPVHSVTESRGSGLGYPQDRKVYATWGKPIVMMCNEHSFSNAEIISHAIKETGRGRVVGMRTAGGVISTGSVGLLDGGSVRMPGRGWYIASTGADMELNGCLPHIALWNSPLSTLVKGTDQQLAAAVAALVEDVATDKARSTVEVEPASQKRLKANRQR